MNKAASCRLLVLCWRAPSVMGLTPSQTWSCQKAGQAGRLCFLNIVWMGIVKWRCRDWYVIERRQNLQSSLTTWAMLKGQWAQTEAEKFHPNMRKNVPLRVMEPWNRLPREVVESPLEIFKTCLDKVLCSLLWVTLLQQEGWTGWPTEVPSDPYHSVISHIFERAWIMACWDCFALVYSRGACSELLGVRCRCLNLASISSAETFWQFPSIYTLTSDLLSNSLCTSTCELQGGSSVFL